MARDLRLVSSNDPNWVEAIKRENAARFYRADWAQQQRDEQRAFDRGYRKGVNTGLFIGCVAGSWLTVALVFVWTVL